MKSILCSSLLILLIPSAYAASLPGDSADGKRLYDANCMGCHDTSVLTRKDRVRSVFGCAEKAVGQLQSCGKKRILCERNARPPQVLERSVLSFPLGVLRGCPLSEGCERGSEADFAGALHNVCFVPEAVIL